MTVVIFLTVLSLNFLGDVVRARFDVRESGAVTRDHRRHVHTTAEGFHVGGRGLLEVADLRTQFRTPRAWSRPWTGCRSRWARAHARAGRRVGLRQVRAVASIMGLLPATALRSGEVSFHGERIDGLDDAALRSYWGTQMSMVFQDPMTSLNPVMRIGRQITESLEVHTDLDRAAARDTAVKLLRSVGIPEPSGASSSIRTSCRAACASGSSSPSPCARWAWSSSSPTSRPRRWT